MSIISELFNNAILISAVAAWFIAQIIKFIVNIVLFKKVNLKLFLSSGGFPSAHSAAVSALSFEIAKYYGWDSPIFAVSVVFSSVVLYDAAGVRRAAGKQAAVLNQLVERLKLIPNFDQNRLKELIGHTPLEVVGGVCVGIIVGLLL